MSEVKTCTCGRNLWQWQLEYGGTSWMRCTNCGDSMFGPDIGVILINWKNTDHDFNMTDVWIANQQDGVVVKRDDPTTLKQYKAACNRAWDITKTRDKEIMNLKGQIRRLETDR